MKEKWVRSIQRQCERKNVSFFFKQWGSVRKDMTEYLLEGRTYDDMPQQRAIEIRTAAWSRVNANWRKISALLFQFLEHPRKWIECCEASGVTNDVMQHHDNAGPKGPDQ